MIQKRRPLTANDDFSPAGDSPLSEASFLPGGNRQGPREGLFSPPVPAAPPPPSAPPGVNGPRQSPTLDGSLPRGVTPPASSAQQVFAQTTMPPAAPVRPANTDGFAAPAFQPTTTGSAMAGWEQSKFGDASHQTPKYGVGRILQQFPPTVDGLAAAMPQIQQAYPGATFNGKDKIAIPVGDGRVLNIDALQGASDGGKAWQWLDLDAQAESDAAQGAGAVGSLGAGAGAGVGGVGGSLDQSLRDSILKLLNPEGDIDAQSDPRSAAFRVAQRRNQDRTRAQMAESAAQSGLIGSGGFEGALRGQDQQRAEAEAAFEAGIAGDQMDEQREGILAALGFGSGLRGQDLQRYGIDTSAGLDRDRLGFDYAALQEMANRQAVLAALGYR